MKPPIIPALFATLVLSGCTVFGIHSGTAEPRYTAIDHVGRVSIREYAPCLAAETTIKGTEEQVRYEGFRRLAGFIFGDNQSANKIDMTVPVVQIPASQKIAMTAPVVQQQEQDGSWIIRFFMPAKYTRETLPVPTNPLVHILEIPAQTYAVLRFSGIPTPQSVAGKQVELLDGLAHGAWQPQGTPVAWFYDPPWTIPFLRRNEVAVPVSRRP